jgi:AcrR family transcriptional regulator
MLQEALISLIAKKEYDAITVDDICVAANVGRSTFYAHYTSKDDLKRSGLDQLRRMLLDRQKEALAPGDTGRGHFGFSLTLLEHARDHRHHYRALLGSRGGAVALGTIREIVSDLVRNELAATGDGQSSDRVPRDLAIQYLVGAYMAVLTWWLDRGAKLPAQEVDAAFRRLATEGVARSEAAGTTRA